MDAARPGDLVRATFGAIEQRRSKYGEGFYAFCRCDRDDAGPPVRLFPKQLNMLINAGYRPGDSVDFLCTGYKGGYAQWHPVLRCRATASDAHTSTAGDYRREPPRVAPPDGFSQVPPASDRTSITGVIVVCAAVVGALMLLGDLLGLLM